VFLDGQPRPIPSGRAQRSAILGLPLFVPGPFDVKRPILAW